MIADLVPETFRHGVLPVLDTAVHELLDPPTVNAHDVVMVRPLVELEDRHSILEMVSSDESGGLELG